MDWFIFVDTVKDKSEVYTDWHFIYANQVQKLLIVYFFRKDILPDCAHTVNHHG